MNTGAYREGQWIRSFLLAAFCVSVGQAQPLNDLFANKTTLAGLNLVTTGTTVGATKEPGEPYHGWDEGGASVWWSWTAPISGFVTLSTAGSTFDTLLGAYTGTTVATLTQIASNDDEDFNAGIATSKITFDVTAGQTYHIAVDGYAGVSGAVRLQIQTAPFATAPPWTLPDPFGVVVNSTAYAGKVVILDFWATWCGPCRAEIPDFVLLQDKYRDDGLVIVGASVDSTSSVVASFLTTFSPTINYQTVMANSAVQQAYGGVSAIPTTFVIDRQNRIRKKWIGTQSGITLEKAIVPLLYGETCLSCRPNGNQIDICWPAGANSFTLESTTDPAAGPWTPWPTSPTLENGANRITVPSTGAPRYFRLRMSY